MITLTDARRTLAHLFLFVAVVLAGPIGAIPVQAETTILTPGTSGDQLFFIYDARGNRVPFIAVTNFASDPVVVEIAFYGQTLNLITTEVATIPSAGNLPTIDPSDTARFPGVAGTAGLVVITPVTSAGNRRPIVPPAPSDDTNNGPLFGGFTLANLDLGAGFGQNPFGRLAVQQSGQRPAAGTLVDGTVVRYQRFGENSTTTTYPARSRRPPINVHRTTSHWTTSLSAPSGSSRVLAPEQSPNTGSRCLPVIP